jgi:hypothetical protein
VEQSDWGNSPSFVGLENFDAWAELNDSTQLVTRRIYGDAVDQPIARVDVGGTAWYHQDVRGSVVALTDGNGTVQTQYAYDWDEIRWKLNLASGGAGMESGNIGPNPAMFAMITYI